MTKSNDNEKNQTTGSVETLEVKFDLKRKYYAIIDEVTALEGRPMNEWLTEAIQSAVEALLDNHDELGQILSEHLKQKYAINECI